MSISACPFFLGRVRFWSTSTTGQSAFQVRVRMSGCPCFRMSVCPHVLMSLTACPFFSAGCDTGQGAQPVNQLIKCFFVYPYLRVSVCPHVRISVSPHLRMSSCHCPHVLFFSAGCDTGQRAQPVNQRSPHLRRGGRDRRVIFFFLISLQPQKTSSTTNYAPFTLDSEPGSLTDILRPS